MRATGPKPDGTPWVVGVQDPDGVTEDYLHALRLGRLRRDERGLPALLLCGRRKIPPHHRPDTLFPADRWRSVTIVCEDSGLADALSTSLFTMTQAEGQALWTSSGPRPCGSRRTGSAVQPGFSELIKE